MFKPYSISRRIFLGAATAALFASPAFADQGAESYIAQILTEANSIFSTTDEASRLDAIEVLVNRHVDAVRVSRFVLGQYARVISDEQKTEYEPLFRKYVTAVYQNSLENYSGQSLEVTGSVDRSEKDIIVNSRVVGAKPGDQYANLVVHWRVYRGKDGKMSVVDAGAEGVWLAIEQQSQFKSVIANNGGGTKGIDALIEDLKSRVGS